LKAVVEPFLTNPEETVATGGAVRVANGCTFRNGALQTVDLPASRIGRFQIVEYLRAFLLGRIGLSNLNSLLIISGAFGLFRTDIVREIGGYETESITEDMELIVRLHRYLIESEREYDVTFLPKPVVWTEVPESRAVLSRQRRRWFRGLLDTLVRHRDAVGRRSYGVVGVFALPFFLFIEALGPLIEGIGYLLLPVFLVLGVLDPGFFVAFSVLAIGLGAVVSALAVYGEVSTYRRYDEPGEVAVLLSYTVLEAFVYRPWRAFVSWIGLYEYLSGDRSWGEMTRTGFGTEESDD
jgi:cellulose synthase/poly-beta-1,6-N-acetylglucosamine synthase-like glycosyltransferase